MVIGRSIDISIIIVIITIIIIVIIISIIRVLHPIRSLAPNKLTLPCPFHITALLEAVFCSLAFSAAFLRFGRK